MDELTALMTARRLRDLERAAFEAIGTMVSRVSDPSLTTRLAEVSRHSAWRAEQWAALVESPLPAAAAAERSVPVALPTPPGEGDEPAVSQWVDRVLADLVAANEEVLVAAEPAGDGPWVRVATRVLADLRLDQAG